MSNGESRPETLPAKEGCDALLVEPDEGYRVAMEACLQLAGCHVECAKDAMESIAALERHPFDVIVSGIAGDSAAPGGLIAEIRVRTQAPIVLVHDEGELVRQ